MTQSAEYGRTRKEPEPCLHSVTQPDCASCWHGAHWRATREYLLLREVVLASGNTDVIEAMFLHEEQRFGANTPDRWTQHIGRTVS